MTRTLCIALTVPLVVALWCIGLAVLLWDLFYCSRDKSG